MSTQEVVNLPRQISALTLAHKRLLHDWSFITEHLHDFTILSRLTAMHVFKNLIYIEASYQWNSVPRVIS